MSHEVYHDPSTKLKVTFDVTDSIFELNDAFDQHLDKLQAMITIVQTHENLSDVNPLNSHHYFWLMEDELERLRHIKNNFSAYLKLHRG